MLARARISPVIYALSQRIQHFGSRQQAGLRRGPAEPHLLRGWRSVIFAPAGDGQRRRRGTDGARLASAIVALVSCLLVIRYDSRIDRAIIQVIHPPPRSITWLVTVVYDAGSFGVTIVLLAVALVARRWVVARDIALSAAGTAAVSGILILLLGSRGGRPNGILIHGYYVGFPVLQIALFMAVAAGVPEADATAAVFIQRLFSSYLPPIWGWITLIWMRKKEYL
jgi:hypothetical protein